MSSTISLFMDSIANVHSAFLQMSSNEVSTHNTSSWVTGSRVTQLLMKYLKRPLFLQNLGQLEWKTETESFIH